MKRPWILLICTLAACSADALPPSRGTAADVTGSWGEDFGPTLAPGNSFLMALHDSAVMVTGTGSYAGISDPL